MKRKENTFGKNIILKISAAASLLALVITSFYLPFGATTSAANNPDSAASLSQFNRRSAPNFDLNESRNLAGIRQATNQQLSAFENFKQSTNAPDAKFRWNEFGGSPDVIYDFASAPSQLAPEDAARAFISSNSALFGVSDVSTLRVFTNREALGGHLIRFQQTVDGIDVKDGGIGVVMNANKQVIMASGPHFRDVNVNTTPTLSSDQARSAADADLQQFQFSYPGQAAQLLQTGLGLISEQAAAANNIEPKLGIYPTADGYKLVWKIAKFSTNPFGLYMISVDAHSGEIIARKDFVHFQQAPGQETADIFPKYPDITDELKNKGIISVCNGVPCGQQRVTLRKFHQSNRVSGLNGTLTGTHALVNNALATKQPFAQAALGTWHFRNDNPAGFEGRTNELDHFAEPAEHQDEINAFFFTTYLLEYVDHLHIGGDNGTFGSQGNFPDDYPNKTNPLPATVHIPDVITPIVGGSYPPVTDPQFAQKVLGLDNAFALNLTSLIEAVSGTKSPLVVNPTFYGHGYLFNDLALEGTVPYHEGMHAITSPIAGLEGDPEGGALNEGQADMWAFTITDNPSLGDYVVNAHKYRQRFRDLGRDPDSVAYIRSANSTLKYGDIGTLIDRTSGQPVFEEHYDGEIYMSTMWEIREMFNRMYPQNTTFKRPRPSDGQALKSITKGTNIFERNFLGSMYILGTTAPDTMVKARDAMIVADQLLYSSDSTDADAPGKHRAMIEQIFAAHELGISAREVSGGKATISTKVSEFSGNQAAPSAPTNVTVTAGSPRSLKVSWNGVEGALAYEILKRPINAPNVRYSNGKRVFIDGDDSTTGFRHVAFVGNQVSYEDKGAINQVFAPAGINDLFSHEYVVRAVAVNTTGQLGFSNLSGSTRAIKETQDLTAQVNSAISNVSFTNGVMAFDNRLTNARGALSTDKTIYAPIKFEVLNISNPTVTVRNADSGGNAFIYNQTLALGATSNAKRLEFNDPMAQMFSFDAKITGTAFTSSTTGTGSQTGDGTGNPPAPVVYSVFREEITGTLAGGDPTGATWGNPATKGLTWQDYAVTTKSDALILDATLSSLTAPDLDFELRTANGQVLARSAGATSTEHVSTTVQPNTTYILRVLGWANGPTTFNIVSNQLLPDGSPNANAGTQTSGGGSTQGVTTSVVRLVRYTVNPLTGSVTAQLLQ